MVGKKTTVKAITKEQHWAKLSCFFNCGVECCMWQKRFLGKRIVIFECTNDPTSLFSSVTVENPVIIKPKRGKKVNLSGCQSAPVELEKKRKNPTFLFLILSCPPLMYGRVWVIPHKVHFMQLGIIRKAFIHNVFRPSTRPAWHRWQSSFLHIRNTHTVSHLPHLKTCEWKGKCHLRDG